MKTSLILKTLLAGVMVVGVIGCGKSKSDGARVNGARVTRAGTGPANLPQGQGYMNTVGYITARDDLRAQFTQAIKHLVSATIDPTYVGTVDNRTGVVLKGYVEVDSMGNVQTKNSVIQIEIRDEYVGQRSDDGQEIQPIVINLKAKAGYASGYNADLVFEDQYGHIRLKGSFNSTSFTGTVSFENKTLYAGAPAGEKPHGGTLGDFNISTCGFFRCQ